MLTPGSVWIAAGVSFFSFFLFSIPALAADIHTLQISGAGPSTQAVQLFAEAFTRQHPEYTIVVPAESIKHRGGIVWALRHGQLFGRLGRPLSAADREEFPTARELPLAQIRIAFAVHRDLGVSVLTHAEWVAIMQGELTNWRQVGGPDVPIIVLGREPGEASRQIIEDDQPLFRQARIRKFYSKDHLMVRAIATVPGAIGFATEGALVAEGTLSLLDINGFASFLSVGLVYEAGREADPLVSLVRAFVVSSHWHALLQGNRMQSPTLDHF